MYFAPMSFVLNHGIFYLGTFLTTRLTVFQIVDVSENQLNMDCSTYVRSDRFAAGSEYWFSRLCWQQRTRKTEKTRKEEEQQKKENNWRLHFLRDLLAHAKWSSLSCSRFWASAQHRFSTASTSHVNRGSCFSLPNSIRFSILCWRIMSFEFA